MRSTLTLLCLMFLCTLNAVAQQLNVTGNVKDAWVNISSEQAFW